MSYTNSPSNKQSQTKHAPSNISFYKSEVAQEMTSFIWSIKGINKVRNNNLWRVPQCEFSAGGCLWSLTLYPSSSMDYLYSQAKLLEPKNRTVMYYMKFYVVNPQGVVVHSSPFSCDQPVVAQSGTAEQCMDSSHKWEVMKFNNLPTDIFSTCVFNDTLNLLIEMNVFKDAQK